MYGLYVGIADIWWDQNAYIKCRIVEHSLNDHMEYNIKSSGREKRGIWFRDDIYLKVMHMQVLQTKESFTHMK